MVEFDQPHEASTGDGAKTDDPGLPYGLLATVLGRPRPSTSPRARGHREALRVLERHRTPVGAQTARDLAAIGTNSPALLVTAAGWISETNSGI